MYLTFSLKFNQSNKITENSIAITAHLPTVHASCATILAKFPKMGDTVLFLNNMLTFLRRQNILPTGASLNAVIRADERAETQDG
jgi:hypothetical protein